MSNCLGPVNINQALKAYLVILFYFVIKYYNINCQFLSEYHCLFYLDQYLRSSKAALKSSDSYLLSLYNCFF